MGGREALRGFAIQTLSVLLDALTAADDDWETVTIEPESANDKVDVLWKFTGGGSKAQQVKSSQNQISKAMAQSWARDLKASRSADEYQLILAGPVAQTVINQRNFEGVDVPPPLALDTLALLDQAVTKIDRYMGQQGVGPLPLILRESLVILVAGKLIDGAVVGRTFNKQEIDGWMMRWITGAYPEAVAQRLAANCEVLWSEIELRSPRRAADRAFELMLPLTVVNGGPGVTAVQWFILEVFQGSATIQYHPRSTSEQGSAPDRPFREFAVLPNAAREMEVLFNPASSDMPRPEWLKGPTRIQLYVKYLNVPAPQLVREEVIEIGDNHLGALDGSPVPVSLWQPRGL